MVKNEIGNKYGNLTVVERVENDKYGNVQWLCKCSCGNNKITKGSTLRNGHCISCGCKNGGDYEILRSGEAPYKSILHSYKTGAKSRNLEFKLSLQNIKDLCKQNCYYCGDKPSTKRYAYHKTRYSKGIETDEFVLMNGIDRLDNSKGYILTNVVPCCHRCNSMKSKDSFDEFILNIKKIMKNLKL